MEKTEGRARGASSARPRATPHSVCVHVVHLRCSGGTIIWLRGVVTRRTRRARPRVAPRARARVLYSVQACSFGRIVRTFCSPANSTPDPHEQCEKLSPRCAMAPFCVSDVLIHRVTVIHLSTYPRPTSRNSRKALRARKSSSVFCECHLSSQIFLLFRSRAAR